MKAISNQPLPNGCLDHIQPLLRELVFVQVDADNGISFAGNLTRVPSIGEAIRHEGNVIGQSAVGE